MNKAIIKTIFTVLVLLLFNCKSDDLNDDVFGGDDPESGWVQFVSSSSATIASELNTFGVPVSLNAPLNSANLTVGYELVSVSGADPNTIFANTNALVIPEGLSSNFGTDFFPIEFNLASAVNITEPMVFDVILTSTDRTNVSVGITDSTSIPISHRVFIDCAIAVTTTYTGDSFSNDLGLPSGVAPAFTATFTPSGENTWDVDSLWGQNFVGFLTGNPAFNGAFPYPGTITIDPNTLEVTVTGTQFYTTGGTGIYNTCDNTFTLNLSQGLFVGTFTVDVVLTPN